MTPLSAPASTPSGPHDARAERLRRNRPSRRDTLWLFAASTGAAALQGCAVSPVTGESILVGLSEAQERQIEIGRAHV